MNEVVLMNSVRPYREGDRERIQQICLDNAGCANASAETKTYTLIMYCNYYIEQEPQNCFVAVNDSDEAVGYLLCSENYDEYERVFSEVYLPQAAAVSAKRYVDAKMDMLTHSMFRDSYKCHFHIDVDENYQNSGLGTQLLSAMKTRLRKRRIERVMLVCDEKNSRVIEFYAKNGFKPLIETKFGLAMGLDLNSEAL